MNHTEVNSIVQVRDAFKTTDTRYEWIEGKTGGAYVAVGPDNGGLGSRDEWKVEVGIPCSGGERYPAMLDYFNPVSDYEEQLEKAFVGGAPEHIKKPRGLGFLKLDRVDSAYHDTRRAYYTGTLREKYDDK